MNGCSQLLPRTGSSPAKHIVAVSAALGASCGILQSLTALPTLPFPFSPEYLLTGAETPGLVQLQYLELHKAGKIGRAHV